MGGANEKNDVIIIYRAPRGSKKSLAGKLGIDEANLNRYLRTGLPEKYRARAIEVVRQNGDSLASFQFADDHRADLRQLMRTTAQS